MDLDCLNLDCLPKRIGNFGEKLYGRPRPGIQRNWLQVKTLYSVEKVNGMDQQKRHRPSETCGDFV